MAEKQAKKHINRNQILKLLIFIVIILILCFIIVKFIKPNISQKEVSSNTDNPTNVNSGTSIKDVEFEGLKIYEISVKKENDSYFLYGKVKNNSNNKFEEKDLMFTFLDNEGKEITTMPIYVPTLEKENESNISAMTTLDIMSVKSVKVDKIPQ